MKLLEESRSIQDSNVLGEKVQLASATIPERMIFQDPSWRRRQWLRRIGKALGVLAVILGALFIASLMSIPMVPSVPGFALVPKAAEIHLAEYLPANRAEAERWLRGDADAHDWRAFTRETLRLEGLLGVVG